MSSHDKKIVYYALYFVKNRHNKKKLQTDIVDHNEIYILGHVTLFLWGVGVHQIILVHISQ